MSNEPANKKPRQFKLPLTTLVVNSDFEREGGLHVLEAEPVLELLNEMERFLNGSILAIPQQVKQLDGTIKYELVSTSGSDLLKKVKQFKDGL